MYSFEIWAWWAEGRADLTIDGLNEAESAISGLVITVLECR